MCSGMGEVQEGHLTLPVFVVEDRGLGPFCKAFTLMPEEELMIAR